MPPILSHAWAGQVCREFGIDPATVRRVVVDAEVGEILRVYFDTYGHAEMLRVDPPSAHGPRVYLDGKDVTSVAA